MQKTDASAFTGIWHRSEPRTARDFGHGVEADTDAEEKLTVALGTDGHATITHQLRRRIDFTGRTRAACGGSHLDLGIQQTFEGSLQDGSIVGVREMSPKAIGADMGRCWSLFTYAPDEQAVFKRVGERLLMYRTDGVAFPEMAEFER